MPNYNSCGYIFVAMVIPTSYLIIVLRNFLSNLFEPYATTIATTQIIFYCKLPYFGPQSNKLQIELSSLLSKYIIDVTPRIVLAIDKSYLPCFVTKTTSLVLWDLVYCINTVTGKKRTGKKHIGKKRTGKKRICIYAHGKKAHSERSAHGKKLTRKEAHTEKSALGKKRTCTGKYNTKNNIYIVVE